MDEDRHNQKWLITQFDQWATTYDHELEKARLDNTFPFAGYDQVLSTVFRQAEAKPGMTVLDLGVGTGNLSKLFLDAGCHVVGADFSPEMLAKARAKLPQLELVQADLTEEQWPAGLNHRFDRIVSNYLFHEFPLDKKITILTRLARQHLHNQGTIIIGDITFPTAADFQRTRQEAGDQWEEEYYWIADQTRQLLEPAGWRVTYSQLSFCAGVYLLSGTDLPDISG